MKRLSNQLVQSRLSHSLSRRSRAAKMKQFAALVERSGATRVLDVGAGVEWAGAQNALYAEHAAGRLPVRLVSVGIERPQVLKARYPGIAFVRGNGLQLPFSDQSFDIAHCNAVIEHVFPIDAREQFITELLRVAHIAFVTTPNKYFRWKSIRGCPSCIGCRYGCRISFFAQSVSAPFAAERTSSRSRNERCWPTFNPHPMWTSESDSLA